MDPTVPHPPSVVERTTIRKVSQRVVPLLAAMFFVNYMDRTAISFAGPNGMNDDLGLTAAQYGLASGIFFVGYIVLEIPSNMALDRFGARVWLARIMITWGVVAMLFTWVGSATQLYWLRFALGVTEAGFFPGAILCLSRWVPARHRGGVLALFYLAQPLTSVIGAPLAGWLMTQHRVFLDLEGWRFMYLCVSVPAVLLGVAAWFLLRDHPRDAAWLTVEERDWLTGEIEAEAGANRRAGHGRFADAVRSPRVWVLSLVYFGFVYGLYALAFFLPTIVEGFETSQGTDFGLLASGLITAIPYVPAAIVLHLWSRDAARRGLRTWHVAGPAVVGGISVPLALTAGTPTLTIAVITVTACCIFAVLPNFWTVPARFLTGGAAAAGIALINTFGNVAGFAAGYVTGFLHDLSGGYLLPMAVVGGFMVLSGVLMVALARRGATGGPAGDVPEGTEQKAAA